MKFLDRIFERRKTTSPAFEESREAESTEIRDQLANRRDRHEKSIERADRVLQEFRRAEAVLRGEQT